MTTRARARSARFRSPLRGPWFTSILGAVLLVGLPIVTVTGLLSYIAYGPQFGQAMPADVGWLRLPQFDWPTDPAWLYRLTQGLHVGLGLVLIPIVLAKLWSVIPKLFSTPPVRSPAQALERLTLIALVGGILFEIVTGILNIQYDYIFGFSFYTAHYWGAWVFIAGFVSHACLKTPLMIRTLRGRSLMQVLQEKQFEQESGTSDLIADDPSEPTISRRGALALVGGGALFVGILTVGQTTGGFLRNAALLLPRGRSYGDGPNDFQVNRTAVAAQISEKDTGADWTLDLTGGSTPTILSREELLRMPQHTAVLPIACVEGWSTTQTWTGVRLRDLASLAGVANLVSAQVTSIEENGPFRQGELQSNQVLHPDSLLALKVNGVDLSADHGYPARIIVPALPGVRNTKWVRSIEFRRV
ncbi:MULTISPECIES: molybdopterin-dependent oxidoreductase [Nocardiaceae]|uniref:molybdopterin-dependent oxidoreductase n=1 Tax=Nocardiaceae TaxID=85025 RepID=UPI001E633C3E|nr:MULTISPECIES: molybdopterin-dependent oxidoreductase [Rhodococcus]MCC8928881.1 molybdopterin-dependent oxidoreductase [Rhodococcus sp. I2R]MCZ4276153.1 molybdopterin-dependent oxidoreductase [Rhodococcus yunnanensis]